MGHLIQKDVGGHRSPRIVSVSVHSARASVRINHVAWCLPGVPPKSSINDLTCQHGTHAWDCCMCMHSVCTHRQQLIQHIPLLAVLRNVPICGLGVAPQELGAMFKLPMLSAMAWVRPRTEHRMEPRNSTDQVCTTSTTNSSADNQDAGEEGGSMGGALSCIRAHAATAAKATPLTSSEQKESAKLQMPIHPVALFIAKRVSKCQPTQRNLQIPKVK